MRPEQLELPGPGCEILDFAQPQPAQPQTVPVQPAPQRWLPAQPAVPGLPASGRPVVDRGQQPTCSGQPGWWPRGPEQLMPEQTQLRPERQEAPPVPDLDLPPVIRPGQPMRRLPAP